MNIQIFDVSKDTKAKIWNSLADQLLDAQQTSQQPLNFALVQRMFPAASYDVQTNVFTAAYERLRAAHRQIMQALDGLPGMKTDLLEEAAA